ncbi:hypothetical protein Tco_1447308 [Tanacetum coccineum]
MLSHLRITEQQKCKVAGNANNKRKGKVTTMAMYIKTELQEVLDQMPQGAYISGPSGSKLALQGRLDLLLTKLEFPQELSKVHNMFHVSNLKKCYADEPLAVLLDGLHLDDKLHFVEEPLEIVGREVKRLKRSRIPLVKVRWNSKRGPEFTWEREDQFKKKYPHLFTKTASSSSAAS